MAGPPIEIPLFPLRTVLFPGMELPLRVFETRYREMLQDVVSTGIPFGVVLIRSGREVGGRAITFGHGTQASIEQMQELANGQFLLQTRGTRRFRIVETLPEFPYPRALVEFLDDRMDTDPERLRRTMESVTRKIPAYYQLSLALTDQWARSVALPDDPHELVNTLGPSLPLDEPLKQALIEDEEAERRLMRFGALLDGLLESIRSEAREHQRLKYRNTGLRN